MKTKIINYSQSWEDPEILLEALKINSEDKVLSVTSGGDNTLALLMAGPKQIICVDKNAAQNYLLELKLSAAGSLPYAEYLEFLGARKSKQRLVLYEKIRPNLSTDTAIWWSAHNRFLKTGPVNCGRFESFTGLFARYILPFAHSKRTIQELQSFSDLEKQRIFFRKKWDTKMWRFAFKLVSNRLMLRKFARQRGMFAYAEGQTAAEIYLHRFEKLLNSSLVKGNYFLHYSLTGNYGSELPPYLQEDGYKRLRTIPASIISTKTIDLLSYMRSLPDNTYSKFNLSDIFEALSPSENDALWGEIIRTSKNGAVVAYWNNLVRRSYPANLSHYIQSNESQLKDLRAKDKVFFYDNFYVHTINK